MKRTTVGIIGGTHGMGRWLAEVLSAHRCTVHVTGRKTPLTAVDAAGLCDVLVVSVPIAATADVIVQVGPLLQEGQALMDLTSLKEEPMRLMLEHCRAEVVGCHPLFGPSVTEASGQNIVLCRGRGDRWYHWIRSIFKKTGYTILEKTPAEHDRIMAVVQVLNHLNTMTLGMALAESGVPPEEVNRFATPVFRTKLDMVKKVFTESPDLYADILAGNPSTAGVLALYERVVHNMPDLVNPADGSRLKSAMKNVARKLFSPSSDASKDC